MSAFFLCTRIHKRIERLLMRLRIQAQDFSKKKIEIKE